jgi:signal peptidase I
LRAAVVLVGLIAVWALLAPVAFGGSASYVMVAGASMEPLLHTGDLVVARQQAGYEPGEVVTYVHPRLGPVIHRVIGVEGDHYVLKGDSNPWIDSYQPTRGEVVGVSWLVLRGAGEWLQWLRKPGPLAVFSLTLAVVVLGVFRKPSKGGGAVTRSRTRTPLGLPRSYESYIFLAGALALAGLLLGFAAMLQPMQDQVEVPMPYKQVGSFSYGAQAPFGVYDQNTIQTGDPIFRDLVDKFDIQFDYSLDSDLPSSLSGSIALLGELRDVNGWRRQFVLDPEHSFDGPSAVTGGQIDLAMVQRMIDRMRRESGLQRTSFTLEIFPLVETSGRLGGTPIDVTYSPRLVFLLDDLQAYLPPEMSPDPGADPLHPIEEGSVMRPATTAHILRILGVPMTTATARWVAGGLVAAALLIVGLLGLRLFLLQRRGEPARIQAEFGDKLLAVAAPPDTGDRELVDVQSFVDLARLAKDDGALILHWMSDGRHHYALETERRVYVYACEQSTAEPPVEEPDAGEPTS